MQMSETQLDTLRQSYATIDQIDPCGNAYARLCENLDQMSDELLVQVAGAQIKFMSLLARNRCVKRGLTV